MEKKVGHYYSDIVVNCVQFQFLAVQKVIIFQKSKHLNILIFYCNSCSLVKKPGNFSIHNSIAIIYKFGILAKSSNMCSSAIDNLPKAQLNQ